MMNRNSIFMSGYYRATSGVKGRVAPLMLMSGQSYVFYAGSAHSDGLPFGYSLPIRTRGCHPDGPLPDSGLGLIFREPRICLYFINLQGVAGTMRSNKQQVLVS